jgi:hypothetical protein
MENKTLNEVILDCQKSSKVYIATPGLTSQTTLMFIGKDKVFEYWNLKHNTLGEQTSRFKEFLIDMEVYKE